MMSGANWTKNQCALFDWFVSEYLVIGLGGVTVITEVHSAHCDKTQKSICPPHVCRHTTPQNLAKEIFVNQYLINRIFSRYP